MSPLRTSSHWRGRWHGHRDGRHERGAVAVFVAILMAVVIPTTSAFVLDLGMQRVARSDMQSLADVVALDLSRELDGRTAAQLSAVGQTLANASRDRNQSVIGYSSNVPSVTPTWGTVDASGNFTAVTGSSVPTAVKVTAATSVGFAFGAFTHVQAGAATRAATATSESGACFKLGSFAAALKSNNSALLGPLLGSLGGSVSTSLVGYQGLATAQVTLGDLATALNAGTPSQLLSTTVTLNDFYVAMVSALKSEGDTADASILESLRLALGSGAAEQPITVGNLLDLSQGDDTALALGVNVFDLVAGSASIANGTNFLSVPGLQVNLAGLTKADVSLYVIEAPKTGCGKPNDSNAAADTAQVKLKISASVLSSLPKVLGLGVSAGPISIELQTAEAHGELTATSCSDKSMDVSVSTQLVPATITIPITVDGGILGSMNLTAVATTVPSDPSSTSLHLVVPDNVNTAVSTGSGNLNVTSASVSISPAGSTGLLGLVGVTLSRLVNELNTNIVATLLSTTVKPLLDTLSTTLKSALGVTLAGADGYAVSVMCGIPRLVG